MGGPVQRRPPDLKHPGPDQLKKGDTPGPVSRMRLELLPGPGKSLPRQFPHRDISQVSGAAIRHRPGIKRPVYNQLLWILDHPFRVASSPLHLQGRGRRIPLAPREQQCEPQEDTPVMPSHQASTSPPDFCDSSDHPRTFAPPPSITPQILKKAGHTRLSHPCATRPPVIHQTSREFCVGGITCACS